jgi:putative ABC transport system substrate-binding protein
MNRRDLVVGLAAAAAVSVTARAEAAKRVGILAPAPLRPIDGFKARLRELGWVEGQNIRFEARWGGDDDTRYPALAAELTALPVDAIMTWGTPAVLAAKRATATIPIVMGANGDPVGIGAVASLARPGGNVTGFSTQNLQLEEKRLELLRELVPGLGRVAFLGNVENPYIVAATKHLQTVAEAAGLLADAIALNVPFETEGGLARILRTQPDAVAVMASPALFPYRRPIVEFMAAHRLPAVYPYREFAEAGGLLAYSTNFDDLFRDAAGYVDKVLRGAKPAEMPVQQAASFELVVNAATARALGLTLPPAILARADEVIE